MKKEELIQKINSQLSELKRYMTVVCHDLNEHDEELKAFEDIVNNHIKALLDNATTEEEMEEKLELILTKVNKSKIYFYGLKHMNEKVSDSLQQIQEEANRAKVRHEQRVLASVQQMDEEINYGERRRVNITNRREEARDEAFDFSFLNKTKE